MAIMFIFLISDYICILKMGLLGIGLSHNNLIKTITFTKLALTLLSHVSPRL